MVKIATVNYANSCQFFKRSYIFRIEAIAPISRGKFFYFIKDMLARMPITGLCNGYKVAPVTGGIIEFTTRL